MLKITQIINHLAKLNLSTIDILIELNDITDNHRSFYFDLTEQECTSIELIMSDDNKYMSVIAYLNMVKSM